MAHKIDPTTRAKCALAAGINEQYLYQCLTGKRDMDAALAVHVEKTSDGALKRTQLRKDWRNVWPELAEASEAA